MKKNIVVISLLFLGSISLAQQNTTTEGLNSKKNELKLAALKLIIYPAIELEYEHFISSSTSVGSNISYAFNNNHPFYDFYFDAFYRFYFYQKQDYGVSGFFAQPFFSFINKNDYEIYDYNQQDDHEISINSLGFGFAFGKKWTNKSGFSLQILGGLGRNFSNVNNFDKIFPRFDIFLGYRF